MARRFGSAMMSKTDSTPMNMLQREYACQGILKAEVPARPVLDLRARENSGRRQDRWHVAVDRARLRILLIPPALPIPPLVKFNARQFRV